MVVVDSTYFILVEHLSMVVVDSALLILDYMVVVIMDT